MTSEEAALEIADRLHERLGNVLWAPESNPPTVVIGALPESKHWHFYAATGKREVATTLADEKLCDATEQEIEDVVESLERALCGGRKEVMVCER